MSVRKFTAVFAAGVLAGCMAGGAPIPAQGPPGTDTGSAARAERGDLARTLAHPLVIDRTDLRIGTTVHFDRIPNVGELHDLTLLPGLAHVVLSLPAWPEDYAPLESLNQMPEGPDLVVVLPDYPPSRAAAEAWNAIGVRQRIVVVVQGPPPTERVILDLNEMRGLERVIAQMDQPSRSGFERLQRPLSFRKLMD